MIKRVTLINFMSHRETVIEPARGLTVIAGENNCGKSAIVAAIQAVCSNASGDFMVRHGEKECRVILETDDDQVVEWRRKSRKVSYIVNGEVIDRTYGKVPEKVEAALRMCKVEAESEEFDVHFGEQKRPIFLLDGTSGQRAAFFASSSDAAKLIEMQNLHKSKVADSKRNIVEYQKRESRQMLLLESLAEVPEIQEQFSELESMERRLLDSEERLIQLRNLQQEIVSESQHFHKCRVASECLTGLTSPPAQRPTQSLEDLCKQLLLTEQERNRMEADHLALQKLPDVPRYHSLSQLEAYCHDLPKVERDVALLTSKSEIHSVPSPPDLNDVGRLEELVASLGKLTDECDSLQSTFSALSGLSKLEGVASEDALARQIVAMNQCLEEVEELSRDFTGLERKTENAHREFHNALEQTGTCPTCGQNYRPVRGAAG